jgi:hypothetical protein
MKGIFFFLLFCVIASSKAPDRRCDYDISLQMVGYKKKKKVFTKEWGSWTSTTGSNGTLAPYVVDGKTYNVDSVVYKVIAK